MITAQNLWCLCLKCQFFQLLAINYTFTKTNSCLVSWTCSRCLGMSLILSKWIIDYLKMKYADFKHWESEKDIYLFIYLLLVYLFIYFNLHEYENTAHLGPARIGWCSRELRTRTPCRGRSPGPACSLTSGTSSRARRGRGAGAGGWDAAARRAPESWGRAAPESSSRPHVRGHTLRGNTPLTPPGESRVASSCSSCLVAPTEQRRLF